MLFRRHHTDADFQPLQYPALIQTRPAATALEQVEQLPLQRQHPVDQCLDVGDMLVRQRIHALALILRAAATAQPVWNIIKRHVQRPEIADKW